MVTIWFWYLIRFKYELYSLAVDTMTDFVTTEFFTPVNQTMRVSYILWRGQLWTDNRRRQLKLISIT